MKTRVWVEHDVEVEISASDAVAAILELPEPLQVPVALNGINASYGFLKRVPDSIIVALNDKQRELIANALKEQAERYVAINAMPSTNTKK